MAWTLRRYPPTTNRPQGIRLDLQRFTTESYPEAERLRAWTGALDRVGLRSSTSADEVRSLHGTIKSQTSTGGF